MGIVRNVVFAILFVAAVYVASANVQLVEIVYLPATGLTAGWEPRSIELPVFLVVLGALVLGALIGGIAALLEQGRLRLALRRATRAERRAVEEVGELEAKLEKEVAAARALREEVAELRRPAPSPPTEIAAEDLTP
jgi:putative membrane protein